MHTLHLDGLCGRVPSQHALLSGGHACPWVLSWQANCLHTHLDCVVAGVPLLKDHPSKVDATGVFPETKGGIMLVVQKVRRQGAAEGIAS